MSQNPYEPPRSISQAVGVKSGRREDLRAVAKYQKGILYCILANIALFVFNIAITAVRAGANLGSTPPSGWDMALGYSLLGLYLIVAVAQLVFIVLLAAQVYNIAIGVVVGLFSFVPCLNLLLLLMVNQKATSVLQRNGIRVGLMGANLSQIS